MCPTVTVRYRFLESKSHSVDPKGKDKTLIRFPNHKDVNSFKILFLSLQSLYRPILYFLHICSSKTFRSLDLLFHLSLWFSLTLLLSFLSFYFYFITFLYFLLSSSNTLLSLGLPFVSREIH